MPKRIQRKRANGWLMPPNQMSGDKSSRHLKLKPGDAVEIGGIRFEIVEFRRSSAKVKISPPRELEIRHLENEDGAR